MKLSAKNKKWITVSAMGIMAAANITSPIDLKGMLPEFLTKPVIGNMNIVSAAAYVLLLGAYWVATKQTE